MTILVNEYHIGASITDATLVQVADRRITVNGNYHSSRKKVFKIPYLNATIGYFGLAQPHQRDFFSSWVPNAIRNGTGIANLHDFVNYFLSRLNHDVSKTLLRNNPSGFHLSGFASDGIPEFHYIRNIDQMNGPYYNGFRDHYYHTEDFRSRDAIQNTNGTARPISNVANAIFWYVNGDLRSFWSFWQPVHHFVEQVGNDPSFSRPSSLSERAKWKLEALASFYHSFARQKIVGKPIDAIEINP